MIVRHVSSFEALVSLCERTPHCASFALMGKGYELFALNNWSAVPNSDWTSYAMDRRSPPGPAPTPPPPPPHSWGPPPALWNTMHVDGERQVRNRSMDLISDGPQPHLLLPRRSEPASRTATPRITRENVSPKCSTRARAAKASYRRKGAWERCRAGGATSKHSLTNSRRHRCTDSSIFSPTHSLARL